MCPSSHSFLVLYTTNSSCSSLWNTTIYFFANTFFIWITSYHKFILVIAVNY
nr:MAG TPA: hypothetical protein [Caudoviricetes sp.]